MKCIGGGAQSNVYRVQLKTPSGNEQEVVLKVYKEGHSLSDGALSERQILGHVPEHKNIVRQRGSGVVVTNGLTSHSAIILEKHELNVTEVMGEPTFICKSTYRTLIDLCLGITSGLQHLHEHGVVHHDVKPDNILISKTGDSVIGDFGSAKLNIDGKTSFTASFRGTPNYMAPELRFWGMCNVPPAPRNHNLRVNEFCDVYSLGILMWELFHHPKRNKKEEFWCKTYEGDCQSVPVVELSHTPSFWETTLYKCEMPEPIRQLIEDCVHFDQAAFDKGKEQVTRPQCSEIYSRLLDMKSSEWANERVSRFIEVGV